MGDIIARRLGNFMVFEGVTVPARTWLGSLYGDNVVQFDLIAHQAMAQKFLRDAHSARLKIAEAVVIDTDPLEH
jgi:hypothetical protein